MFGEERPDPPEQIVLPSTFQQEFMFETKGRRQRMKEEKKQPNSL